jgi:uncharacterized protein
MVDERVIDRPRYWGRLQPWVGKPLIKVLTGQRRVGKSYLLKALFKRLIRRSEGPVLLVEMERADFSHLRTGKDLTAWVAAQAPKGKAVLMIDEVQEISGFDTALRSLLAEGRFDMYVTGSNAELLSGEIASRFAGRAAVVEVHPLSYDEFLVFHGAKDDDGALERYLRFGGLPFLRHLDLTDAVVFEYLHGVAETVLLKDVVARHAIRSHDLLERLVLFLADNVGAPVSAQSIARFLKSERVSASVPTLLDYLARLSQAYLVRRVRRADLESKRFFQVAEKHYFVDLGIRAALRGARSEDVGKVVENAVLARLLVDGWQVTTGAVGDREIDFVCRRGEQRLYVQACYLMADAATREREMRSLLAIADNFPKMVVSLDPIVADERGVVHRRLRDFLRDGCPR